MELKLYRKFRWGAAAIGWSLLLYHFATCGFDFRWEGFFVALMIGILTTTFAIVVSVFLRRYRWGIRGWITRHEGAYLHHETGRDFKQWQRRLVKTVAFLGMSALYWLPPLYIGISLPLITMMACFSLVLSLHGFLTDVVFKRDWPIWVVNRFVGFLLMGFIALPYGVSGILASSFFVYAVTEPLKFWAWWSQNKKFAERAAVIPETKRKVRRAR